LNKKLSKQWSAEQEKNLIKMYPDDEKFMQTCNAIESALNGVSHHD